MHHSQYVLLVGMVQTALINVVKTATAVTDFMEPVNLDASPGGKEDTAKKVQKGLSKCKCI